MAKRWKRAIRASAGVPLVLSTMWGCRAILGIDEELPIVATGEDAASDAASHVPDTGISVTDAANDADSPRVDLPNDSPCTGLNAWNVGTKAESGCAARRTFVVMGDVLGGIEGYCRNIAIAIAHTGRVVVACHDEVSGDEGHLLMRSFQPKTPAFSMKELPTVKGTFADDIGHGIRLAGSRSASDPDAVHAVYQTMTNGVSGPVLYRLVGASTLGPEETVAVAVARTSMSIAASSTGNVAVSYADIAAPDLGAHEPRTETIARERAVTSGAFSKPASLDVMAADTSTQVDGIGRSRLRYDERGRPHAAIFNVSNGVSGVATYSVKTGGVFETRSLETGHYERLSGQSIDLAVFGETKTAAYFSTTQDAGPSLILASWIALPSPSTYPTYETLIPSGQIHRLESALYRQSLSLDVDKFGLLHLAVVIPISPTQCTIEYRRQKRISGTLSWVVDVIAANLTCDGSAEPLVDLVVDDSGRPHIAYFTFDPTMRVEYATRFDR